MRKVSYLSESSGLSQVLFDAFGKETGEQLLAVAMHQASEGEAMYLANDWAEDVGINTALPSSTLGRLMANTGMDHVGVDKFFQKWIVACGNPTVLIHDTTSISTYARMLDLAEWGYNRDGEELPQVNLALVVDRENRLPLWYRTIPGSIPDVATLKLTCKMLKDLGLNSFSFALDRGYFSNTNLTDMIIDGLEFTIGAPLSSNQAKEILKKNRRVLTAVKRSFLYGDTRLRHIECTFTVAGQGKKTIDLPAHLYFDPDRKEQTAKRIEMAVLELENKASKRSFANRFEAFAWIADNAGRLKKFLTVSCKNNNFQIVRKSNGMAKVMNDFGFTLIVTNNQAHCRDTTLSDYRCRDIAEKIFDIYKNGANAHRLRSGSNGCVNGRLFVSFLAVVLRALVESKLRNDDLMKNHSVTEALNLLGKIKRIKFPDGKTYQLEIPKKTRIIAEAIGMPIPR